MMCKMIMQQNKKQDIVFTFYQSYMSIFIHLNGDDETTSNKLQRNVFWHMNFPFSFHCSFHASFTQDQHQSTTLLAIFVAKISSL